LPEHNAALAIFDAMIDQLALACGEFNSGFKYSRFRDACYAAAKLHHSKSIEGKVNMTTEITLVTCPFTIITQARHAAFNIVKLKLISQGVKTSTSKRSTITAAANEYLQHHPELIEQAAESIMQLSSSAEACRTRSS